MALTGTLKDFGIAEILQLIGTQKKTGVLTLEDRQHRAEIEFSDGMVVGAMGGPMGLTLEERLVKAGFISYGQRDEALRMAKETLKPLSTVLTSENMVDVKDLRSALALHVSEIVFETFAWKSGTYAFEQKFIQWDKNMIAPMSAESIMMDGLRIVDETPSLRKLIPSLSEKYAVLNKQATNRDLGTAIQTVLDLLDGQRTVQDVMLRSRMSQFDVLKHIAKLMSEGIIGIAPPENGAAAIPVEAPVKSGKLPMASRISIYTLLAVVGLLALWRFGGAIAQTAYPFKSSSGPNSASSMVSSAQIMRIRNALETYRLSKGAYPDSLERLTESGLLNGGDLSDPQRRKYKYSSNGRSYTLKEADGIAPAKKPEESHR